MRIFAFEFFSGGGLVGRPLPSAIAHEGDMMLATLIRELSEIPGIEPVTSRDLRLPPLPGCVTLSPTPQDDAFTLYARGLAQVDAAWPTAPESGGILERLAGDTVAQGRMLLGCPPGAVRLAASKRATAVLLHQCGIAAVPSFAAGDVFPPLPGPWVVKPDDGAGCEGARLAPDWTSARALLESDPDHLIAQPWLEGEPLSLSLICARGAARLIACNRQQIAAGESGLSLDGVVVNAVADKGGRLSALADDIAAAIPELWGYVGVDLILSQDGPIVLEINPRLTTSYCGLGAAVGINLASLVLTLACTDLLPSVRPPAGSPIEIRLGPPADA